MATQDPRTTTMLRSAKQATIGAAGVLLRTTVQHRYGGGVSRTPWRWHAAIVSALAAALLGGSLGLLRRRGDGTAGRVAFWVFTGARLAVPVVGVGLVEGGFNHLAEDVLEVGGASPGGAAAAVPAGSV